MLGDSALIIRQARNAKLRLLRKGVFSKSSWADMILFNGLQAETNLASLQLLALEGGMLQSRIEFFRLALGAPAISTLENKFLLAPLTAGLEGDCQRLPPPGLTKSLNSSEVDRVGAPTVGTEIKLRGEEEDFARGRMRGEVRQPTSGNFLVLYHRLLTILRP